MDGKQMSIQRDASVLLELEHRTIQGVVPPGYILDEIDTWDNQRKLDAANYLDGILKLSDLMLAELFGIPND